MGVSREFEEVRQGQALQTWQQDEHTDGDKVCLADGHVSPVGNVWEQVWGVMLPHFALSYKLDQCFRGHRLWYSGSKMTLSDPSLLVFLFLCLPLSH